MVWNPYLGQTRWIVLPITDFDIDNMYVLGYDINHNHKIFSFVNQYITFEKEHIFQYEIYDFSSDSWRVLDVTPDWPIDYNQRGVSLKGSCYFFAQVKIRPTFNDDDDYIIEYDKDFLLCFDFTRERFGPPLFLPFRSNSYEIVTLSCVKEEKLAVLYLQKENSSDNILHIWITTKIEPNTLSWSKFLRVEMGPFAITGARFNNADGSFLVDEKKKVVVLFDLEGDLITTKTARYHKAYIIGEDGYFKSVSLGEAKVGETCPLILYWPSLVCSSFYLPSLVQLNQPGDD